MTLSLFDEWIKIVELIGICTMKRFGYFITTLSAPESQEAKLQKDTALVLTIV